MQEEEQRLEGEIAALLQQADAVDEAEDGRRTGSAAGAGPEPEGRAGGRRDFRALDALSPPDADVGGSRNIDLR